MTRLRLLATLAVLLCAALAAAQEFDVFDANDFLDPRLRGVILIPDERGVRMSDEAPFLVSKVSLGRVSDYYSRTAPTGADVTVAHMVTSYYRGRHQFNLKLTNFAQYGGTSTQLLTVPRNRATVQWGIYEADVLKPDPSAEPVTILHRYVFSLSAENGSSAGSRNYELGSELDVRFPGTAILGTLSYALRHTEDGVSQRFAYVYRISQQGFKRINVDTSVGYVAQKAGHWQWGNIRPAVHARLALDRLSTGVHLAYAPTISVIGGVRVSHEAAIFVDYTTIAHVFRRRSP